jgi:hypothetical protein
MPIFINEENRGRRIVVRASGKLRKVDYMDFVPKFERLLKLNVKLDVIFEMTQFHGGGSFVVGHHIFE